MIAMAAELIVGILGSAVLTAGTIYATVIRKQLTRDDHEQICEGRQALVFEVLKNIKEQLEKQDKKLDRLLFNGSPNRGPAGRSAGG